MSDLRPPWRYPLLVLGMISLVAGVLAGLARLGWAVPEGAVARATLHAPLMIGAFFGTVISLERAVAVARAWAYLGPAAAGLGGLALVTGLPMPWPAGLATLGALILAGASALVLRRQAALHTGILLLGALCWLLGNGVWWYGGDVLAPLPWWFAFLVLTIAGERLELTRFLPTPPAARPLFVGIVLLLVTGAAVSLPLFGAALLGLALWLLRYDIARRNRRQPGLTGFIALCLLSGYVWLAVAGLLGVAGQLAPGQPWRDAALHAVGLGFVFAMVFGHAPIIFPAVARVKIPYSPLFYLPLVVLQASLAWRVAGGLTGEFSWRSGGGLVNGLALALFIVTMIGAVRRGRREENRHGHPA